MRKNKLVNILILSMLLLCSTVISKAQDTLLLLNGKQLVINNYKIDSLNSEIQYTNIKGKQKFIYTNDVFSYTTETDKTVVLFDPIAIGDDNSVDEMRRYVYGERDAWKLYKPKRAALYGFLVGFISPFVIDPRFSPIVPMAFGIAYGNSMPNNPMFIKSVLNKPNDVYYTLGYTEIIRKKRTYKALSYGGVGVILGILASWGISKL